MFSMHKLRGLWGFDDFTFAHIIMPLEHPKGSLLCFQSVKRRWTGTKRHVNIPNGWTRLMKTASPWRTCSSTTRSSVGMRNTGWTSAHPRRRRDLRTYGTQVSPLSKRTSRGMWLWLMAIIGLRPKVSFFIFSVEDMVSIFFSGTSVGVY